MGMARNTNPVPERNLRRSLDEAVAAGAIRAYDVFVQRADNAHGNRRRVTLTLADGERYECSTGEALSMAAAAIAAVHEEREEAQQ
jgi:hypothetical protein